MPYTLNHLSSLNAPSFFQLYQPIQRAMIAMPPLEAQEHRPLKMTFKDQLKALIFFPLEDLSGIDRFIIDSNGLLPRLLVKTNAQQLRINGISQMPDTLHALSERIKIRFFHCSVTRLVHC